MKKKLLGVSLSCVMANAMALTMVFTLPVCAEEAPRTCHVGGCDMGQCFTDEDCDGICGDHAFVDEDCDGICDNHCYMDEDCDGVCDYFIDEDADGICDHCHEHGRPAQTAGTTADKPSVSRSRGHHGSHHRGSHRGHC
ncbi:MAG: hypothetical protein NC337_11165 [Roseburia sp.]|nr:hypothetical protein [Roseburia sp.]